MSNSWEMKAFVLILAFLIITFGKTTLADIKEYQDKQAREAPFCVDETIEEVKKFQPVFKYFEFHPHEVINVATTPELIDKEPGFVVPLTPDSIPKHNTPYKHKYKSLEVTFTRMNPKPVPPKQQLFNLRQWFHIQVHSDVPLLALYVQSVSAPLGIPFGEFRADFNCFDCRSDGQYYSVKDGGIQIIPCRFRSFHSYTHPQVVVIGGNYSVSPFFDAHFHFNWFEASCQEASFMQFLFVAVTDWDDIPDGFDAFYSQVINNTVPDSIDGTAYPFYIDFDGNMGCHEPEHGGTNWTSEMIRQFDPLKAQPYKKLHSRLKYNKDYDDCVNNGGAGGDGKNQCPPGPFRCIKTDGKPLSDQEFDKRVKDRIEFDKQINTVCPTCPFDTEGQLLEDQSKDTILVYDGLRADDTDSQKTEGYEIEDDVEEIDRDSVRFENEILDLQMDTVDMEVVLEIEKDFWLNGNETIKAVNKIHEILSVFAWVTCPLISNYLVRFYKESGHADKGVSCFNVGVWLWAHIGLSYASLAAMWGGLGIVIFYDSSCTPEIDGKVYGCSDSSHQGPAITAMIMFHVQQLNGWCRPISTSMRNIYIWWHVIFGYGAQFFGVISYFIMGTNTQVTVAIVLSFVVGIIFYGISTWIQWDTDSKLQLTAKRTGCPIPEAITVLPDAPYVLTTTMLLLAFILVQLCLFFWIVLAVMKQ